MKDIHGAIPRACVANMPPPGGLCPRGSSPLRSALHSSPPKRYTIGTMRTPLLSVLAASALAVPLLAAAAEPGPKPIYIDPSQPVEKRVDDLVSRMSLDEKISQLMIQPSIGRWPHFTA